MCRQFRHALSKAGGGRGQVSMAEILRMTEDSLVASWDPSLAAHLNSTVGYFINGDGFLDYDVLRQHRKSDGSCGMAAEQGDGAEGSAGAAAAGSSARGRCCRWRRA